MTPEYVHTSDEPRQLATQVQYDYILIIILIFFEIHLDPKKKTTSIIEEKVRTLWEYVHQPVVEPHPPRQTPWPYDPKNKLQVVYRNSRVEHHAANVKISCVKYNEYVSETKVSVRSYPHGLFR